MRTTASLVALVTLLAVANSNAAPIGAPNGPSARSVSRAREQLRSRDVAPMPDFRDVSFKVGAPDVKCGDCREGEAKKVSTNVTGPVADMEGGLKDMKNKVFSNGVQVPGVPSGSGSIGIDVGDDEGPDNGTSTRPQKHANDDADDGANDGASDGASDDGRTDDGKTDDGKTDDGKSDDGKSDGGKSDGGKGHGKTDPSAEQPPYDDNEVEAMRDEVEDDSKAAEDMTHGAMAKAKGKSDRVSDHANATSSSMNQGIHEFSKGMKNKAADVGQMADDMSEPDMDVHAGVEVDAKSGQDSTGKSSKMPKGNGTMPEVATVSQEPSSENTDGKDCEDETTVEMQEGNPSVSTEVVRR